MRVPPSARISPRPPHGSSFGLLIPLDEALPAGRLEARAQFCSLVGGGKGPDHGPVIRPLGAQIDFVDQRLSAAELAGELCLQGAEGRLGLGFAALRRHLDVAARPARAGAAGRGRRRERSGARRARRVPGARAGAAFGFSDSGALLLAAGAACRTVRRTRWRSRWPVLLASTVAVSAEARASGGAAAARGLRRRRRHRSRGRGRAPSGDDGMASAVADWSGRIAIVRIFFGSPATTPLPSAACGADWDSAAIAGLSIGCSSRETSFSLWPRSFIRSVISLFD